MYRYKNRHHDGPIGDGERDAAIHLRLTPNRVDNSEEGGGSLKSISLMNRAF